MSTLGIVFLSLFGGLFLALILASSAWLVYISFTMRRNIAAVQRSMDSFSLDVHKVLSDQQKQFSDQISRINVTAFETSAKRAISAATRIETAAVAFGELAGAMLSDKESALKSSSLGPEEYAEAEAGERYVTSSSTGCLDRDDERNESQEVTGRSDF